MSIQNSSAVRDIASIIHPYTNLDKHQTRGPLIMDKGEGIYLFDDQGHKYLDGMSSLWCASLGYSEPRLVEVAHKQLQKLPFFHLFNHRSHNPAIDLAEQLLAIAPGNMTKVLFSNSGSEANDTAVKLVWYYNNAIGRPEKRKIIARERGYHGVTIAAGSLTGLASNHAGFNLPIPGILHTDCPSYYHYAKSGETEEAFVRRLAQNLEAMILREGPDTVAAFIAEPVNGSGGVIVPPATYFTEVQKVLKKYDILFIVDEVICGFGRTGKMFGSETFGIVPDIVTVAKALSASYMPISAVMVNERLHQGMIDASRKHGVFAHGVTYSGHPVCAAVALETLKIYEERDIVGHVQSVAPAFQEGLRQLGQHPLVGEARGVGLIGALEIVADKATAAKFDSGIGIAAFLENKALDHGLIIRTLRDGSVAICPPLIVTQEQVQELLLKLGAVLDDAADMLSKQGWKPRAA